MMAAAITRMLNVEPLMGTRLGVSVADTGTPVSDPTRSQQNNTLAPGLLLAVLVCFVAAIRNPKLDVASRGHIPLLTSFFRALCQSRLAGVQILTMSIRIVPDDNQPSASIEIA